MKLNGILGFSLDLDRSDVLYDRPFSRESLAEDFLVPAGDWSVEDGWLWGRIQANAGGFAYSRTLYPGNVLLDFTAQTVPPCDHDLNFTWRSEGWDEGKGDAGRGYIAGLSGWYEGKSGIERYPETTAQAMTSLFHLEPGRSYHVQAGTVEDRCFIFLDGALLVDLKDPAPLSDPAYGRIGLGVFYSSVRFRDLKVLRPSVTRTDPSYLGFDRTSDL